MTLGVMVRLYVCSPTMTTEIEGLLQARQGREAMRCHEENLHVGRPHFGWQQLFGPARQQGRQQPSQPGSAVCRMGQPWWLAWSQCHAAVPCSSSSRVPDSSGQPHPAGVAAVAPVRTHGNSGMLKVGRGAGVDWLLRVPSALTAVPFPVTVSSWGKKCVRLQLAMPVVGLTGQDRLSHWTEFSRLLLRLSISQN